MPNPLAALPITAESESQLLPCPALPPTRIPTLLPNVPREAPRTVTDVDPVTTASSGSAVETLDTAYESASVNDPSCTPTLDLTRRPPNSPAAARLTLALSDNHTVPALPETPTLTRGDCILVPPEKPVTVTELLPEEAPITGPHALTTGESNDKA